MKKVLITRPVPEVALQVLGEHFEVKVLDEGAAEQPDVLEQALADCDGALVLITESIGEAHFAAAPRLRVVANMAVGYNNIDTAAAAKHGVTVTNTPDVLTETTADLAWALILGCLLYTSPSPRDKRQSRMPSSA